MGRRGTGEGEEVRHVEGGVRKDREVMNLHGNIPSVTEAGDCFISDGLRFMLIHIDGSDSAIVMVCAIIAVIIVAVIILLKGKKE